MLKQKIDHLELWKKYKLSKSQKEKEKYRNQLMEIYYPLVKKISYKLAEKIKWKRTPEELTSFGVDGLIIAIQKFEVNRGVKFEAFSSIRIRGSMIDNIRKEDNIPRTVRINNSKIEKIQNKMESEKGRKVSQEEVFKKLGLVKKKKKEWRLSQDYYPVNFLSLDNLGSDKDNEFKQSFNINLIDNTSKSPDTFLFKKEFFNKIASKNFSKIEQKIIYLYYYEGLTMEMIAKNLDMSESRISQIHKILLNRLKNKIFRNPEYFKEIINRFSDEKQ
ncbi:MAG TPA: sigma-70 family RNA polymerase sigma factor [Candidatus Paceibacterota bacterium]|nr:sigma-70 family RNA polymerase sigma factor [Candidatus Paceibacterota bacterium]